jgi:hypothetical protein
MFASGLMLINLSKQHSRVGVCLTNFNQEAFPEAQLYKLEIFLNDHLRGRPYAYTLSLSHTHTRELRITD